MRMGCEGGAASFVGASLPDTVLLVVTLCFWLHSHAERKATELGTAMGVAAFKRGAFRGDDTPGELQPSGILVMDKALFLVPTTAQEGEGPLASPFPEDETEAQRC